LGNGRLHFCGDRQGSALRHRNREANVEYFAGLDVSMDETHLCVVDHDGVVTAEAKG
jgi:hypothetical protein